MLGEKRKERDGGLGLTTGIGAKKVPCLRFLFSMVPRHLSPFSNTSKVGARMSYDLNVSIK